jgi:nitroreductase
MDLIETLRTTGAAREFRGDPVLDEVIRRVLDNARFAPSGGNRQASRDGTSIWRSGVLVSSRGLR